RNVVAVTGGEQVVRTHDPALRGRGKGTARGAIEKSSQRRLYPSVHMIKGVQIPRGTAVHDPRPEFRVVVTGSTEQPRLRREDAVGTPDPQDADALGRRTLRERRTGQTGGVVGGPERPRPGGTARPGTSRSRLRVPQYAVLNDASAFVAFRSVEGWSEVVED